MPHQHATLHGFSKFRLFWGSKMVSGSRAHRQGRRGGCSSSISRLVVDDDDRAVTGSIAIARHGKSDHAFPGRRARTSCSLPPSLRTKHHIHSPRPCFPTRQTRGHRHFITKYPQAAALITFLLLPSCCVRYILLLSLLLHAGRHFNCIVATLFHSVRALYVSRSLVKAAAIQVPRCKVPAR